MKILVGNNHLEKTGGTENYTYALALALKELGHEVEYFTFHKGPISDKLENEGIKFMSHSHYDLICANHTTVVQYLSSYGFTIQTCHGVFVELEQPSPLADWHVGVTQEICDHIRALGYDCGLLLNGIDCNRFSPINPLSKELKCVLSLCQNDIINEFIKDCCNSIGVKFMASNKYTDNVWDIENQINQADLVVGIGRSLYDAMACGRCVLSFDRRDYMNESIGDGYLDKSNIDKSIYHNLSGRGLHKTFSKEEFIAELKKYNPADGVWAREYALRNLNIKNQALTYISYYEELFSGKELYLFNNRIKNLRVGLKSLSEKCEILTTQQQEISPKVQKLIMKRKKDRKIMIYLAIATGVLLVSQLCSILF